MSFAYVNSAGVQRFKRCKRNTWSTVAMGFFGISALGFLAAGLIGSHASLAVLIGVATLPGCSRLARSAQMHQCRIAHTAHGFRVARREPADIDDPAPLALAHVRHTRLAHPEIPDQLGIQIQQQIVFVGQLDVIANQPTGRRGAIDQNVN
jgi:hypothetical protein